MRTDSGMEDERRAGTMTPALLQASASDMRPRATRMQVGDGSRRRLVMSAEIINLNRVRKEKARREKAAVSEENALFRHVEAQIARFERGETLQFVVDRAVGY